MLYGDRKKGEHPRNFGRSRRWYGVKGFFDWLETKAYKMHVRVLLSRYRSYNLCEDCHGGRFQPATLNFKVDGLTLPELAAKSIGALHEIAENLKSKTETDPTAEMLRNEVASRLRYLVEVGLGYLSLDRPTRTLSGGEVERVNLTTCLGASLVNTLFVLDEPSVGLHPRDTGRLIRVMKKLRDKGNTLLVVEHEEAVIRAADNLIELRPGARGNGRRTGFQRPDLRAGGREEVAHGGLFDREKIHSHAEEAPGAEGIHQGAGRVGAQPAGHRRRDPARRLRVRHRRVRLGQEHARAGCLVPESAARERRCRR